MPKQNVSDITHE